MKTVKREFLSTANGLHGRWHWVLVTGLLLFAQRSAHAQWKLVADFNHHGVRVVKANQWNVLFAGINSPDGAAPSGIWRSTDLGLTWHEIPVVLQSFKNYGHPLFPEDFSFKDSLTGWFTGIPSVRLFWGGEIYKTSDGGSTWHGVFLDNSLQPRSIYYSPLTKRLLAGLWIGGGLIGSSDEGDSWNDVIRLDYSYYVNGFVAIDSVINVTSGMLDFGPNPRSTDGGLTWRAPVLLESWQTYADVSRRLMYAAFDGEGQYYRSADLGLTWSLVSTFWSLGQWVGDVLTGCIAGDDEHNIYAQREVSGIYRSTDSGTTWQGICGPSNTYDTRFCVVGHVIIAGDSSGRLWRLDMSIPQRVTLDSVGTMYSSDCQLRRASLLIHSTFPCFGSATLDSVTVSGSPAFRLQEQLYQHNGLGEDNSVTIEYQPSNDHDTSFATLHFTIQGVRRDTTVMLIGSRGTGSQAQMRLESASGAGHVTLAAGETTYVVLRLESGVSSGAGFDSVTVTIPYDANALSVAGPILGANGWLVASDTIAKGLITLHLYRSTKDSIAPGTELARIPLTSFIAGDSVASVALTGATFNATSDCTTLSFAEDTVTFIIPGGCGQLTMRHFMATGSPFEIKGIHPNPAANTITVSYVNGGDAPVTCTVYDILGRERGSRVQTTPSGAIDLDVSSLPEGSYYLRISCGAVTRTERVRVVR